MRFVTALLALLFVLATMGPETHACPVHSATPAHHQGGGGHQKAGHCTCPQACCPAGVAVSIPTTTSNWSAAPLPVITVDLNLARPGALPSRKRVLPFALAPPQLLA